MTKEEFKKFCKEEFYKRGFKKVKNKYYLVSDKNLLCGIEFQKSNYSNSYYINYYFYIGDYKNTPITEYPSHYQHDIYARFDVISRTQTTINGELFKTSAIEYEEYTPETLRPFFDKTFDIYIMPPMQYGKKYILDNLNVLYQLFLREEEVMEKLKAE